MKSFESLFGHVPTVEGEARGRVNLIGEHTDYNGGFVLPIAIPQRTRVQLAARTDRWVRCWSTEVPSEAALEYLLGEERQSGTWLDYVQGVTAVLRDEGHSLTGFDLGVESEIPRGAGLASSAALEVAVLRALRIAFGLTIGDVQLAQIGQRAEVEFVGARVGIMDQLAACLANEKAALFVDTRSLAFEEIRWPAEAELVVIHSGVSHDHAAGEYNQRRRECEEAARLLGVGQLRDVGADEAGRLAELPAPLDRRAQHVVSENGRVLAAVRALQAGDLPALGAVLTEGHYSLRDYFEVSLPEIDGLVDLARRQVEVFGARMTGGGFGGSVVVLTRSGSGKTVGNRVVEQYLGTTGVQPRVLVPRQ